MPGSSVTTFLDPGAYQEAIGSAQVEMLVTARGDFRVELTRVDLNQMSIQRGRETLPRIGRGDMNAAPAAIYFLVDTNQASNYHCEVEFAPNEILINAAGSTYTM